MLVLSEEIVIFLFHAFFQASSCVSVCDVVLESLMLLPPPMPSSMKLKFADTLTVLLTLLEVEFSLVVDPDFEVNFVKPFWLV